jgi:predicted HD phosphohydrolase
MDRGTARDWADLQRATDKWQASTPQRIKSLLGNLSEQHDGMAIDQLQHSLQTATRALRAGVSEELIVAALCHDIGTGISHENHCAIGAAILRPYVSEHVYQIVLTHQDFQRLHYHQQFGKSIEARRRYAGEPWFGAAERFSDEWDQASFDPNYETYSLDYFSPALDAIFATPRRLRGAPELRTASVRPSISSGWLKRVRDVVFGGRPG